MMRTIRNYIKTCIARFVGHGEKSGAATLVMTLVLLMLSTLIIIYAANYGALQDRAIANINRNHQAFEAAQAGLEYGINYLNKNSGTILANPVSGFIPAYSDSHTSNVSLPNKSSFTITYSNPVAYNYTLIKIASTGLSDDGSATHSVSQLVKFGSILLNKPSEPFDTKGSGSFTGSSQINNQYNNTTIKSASTVTLAGSAETVLSSGVSSTAASMGSDVVQNYSTFGNMSGNDFFSSYFGLSQSLVKSSIGNYYSNSSDTNYQSMLSGKTGTSIWIDQTAGTATINGFAVIGSTANPVLMIVNGNNNYTGWVIIYGFVYINGTVTIASSANIFIIGGIATTGNLSGPGTLQIYYSPSVLTNLQNQPGMQYYAKVPGSWKDF